MRKYFAMIGGLAIAVFAALVLVPESSYGYARKGDEYQLPAGCGAKLVTAISSVFAGVDINAAQRWTCRRTLTDTENPNGAVCWGEYLRVIDGATWWSSVQADGFDAWRPIDTNDVAGTVTVRRRSPQVELNSAQMTAHSPLFTDGCIRQDDESTLLWSNVIDFTVSKTETNQVFVQTNYLTSDGSVYSIAELAKSGKALWPLAE